MPAAPASLALGRFKRLALRSNDIWQGGIFRLPTWIEQGPEGRPYRPWAAVWVSERTGLMHLEPEPEFDAHGPSLALAALLELGLRHDKHLGGRAARLCVTDAELAAFLAAQLNDPETTIGVVDDVPAVREVLRQFALDINDGEVPPEALEAPGVTIDRLRAFADAAACFYRAAPWEHLQNDDLIVIQAPKLPRALSRLVVMGNAGLHYGLAFFESRAAFERMAYGSGDIEDRAPAQAWALYFGAFDELPFGDADAWEQHDLPVAGPDAYPHPVRVSGIGDVRAPNAVELNLLEALLRALAATTEDQLDAGEWGVEVTAHDGPVAVRLTLPVLLEAERGKATHRRGRVTDRRVLERASGRVQRFLSSQQFESLDAANEALASAQQEGLFDADRTDEGAEPLTPLARAQELVYDAAEVEGRLRVKRAREALAIAPDCADAWSLLAEAAASPARARDLYQQATDAGARALGPEAFETLVGRFWGHLETRPYMRARFGLAQALEVLGEHGAAIDHYRALLRLNPGDNQGVRYVLLALLLRVDRDDEVEPLLQEYEGDIAAEWVYGRTLWLFRRDGDTAPARVALDEAARGNPHVVPWMLQPEHMPIEQPPHFVLGSPEEALYCVAGLRHAWEKTPGALDWLRRRAPRAPASSRSGRRGSSRRRR